MSKQDFTDKKNDPIEETRLDIMVDSNSCLETVEDLSPETKELLPLAERERAAFLSGYAAGLEEARKIALKKKDEKLSTLDPHISESESHKKSESSKKSESQKKIYMDKANQKAMNVWVNEGETAAIKHMFTDQETGRERSYAEMRMLYG